MANGSGSFSVDEKELAVRFKFIADNKGLINAEKQVSEETRKMIAQFTKSGEEIEKLIQKAEQLQEKWDQNIARSRQMRAQGQRLQQGSRMAFIAGGAGVGGLVALASSYVRNAKEADDITRRWAASQKLIADSQQEIAKTAAQIILPLYERMANVVERVSDTVQKHPELIKIAFGAAAGIGIIGLLGMAVAQGIKLTADVIYIATVAQQTLAAKLMATAANKQLMAATIAEKGVGGGLKLAGANALAGLGGGSIAAIAGTVTAVLAAIAGGAALGAFINDVITKATGRGATTKQFALVGANTFAQKVAEPLARATGTDEEEIQRKTQVFLTLVAKFTGLIDEDRFNRAAQALQKTSKALDELSQVAGHPREKEIVQAYEDMLEQEKQITQEAAQRRIQLLEAYAAREQQIVQQNAARVQAINTNAIRAITETTKAYREGNAEAEKNYFEARQKIAESAGEQAVRMEQALQERLRKMRMEHEDRMAEFAARRDALGLVKEERAYDRARAEEERSNNLEIKQLKAEVAKRLRELAESYAKEREQRHENFLEQIAQIRQQQAEQLKEQAAAYSEQLKELRAAKTRELKELQVQTRAQLEHNRQAFITYLRQLDASLIGEANLRQKRYTEMLAGVDKFLLAYNAKMATLNKVPGKSAGGYTVGLVNTGEEGREYILNAQTTRAAEKVLGTNLSQAGIIRALTSGNRNQITLNDNRRLESTPSVWQQRQMNDMITEAIQGAFS